MMRILILGGTGLVGPHVVRRLAARGHRVSIVHKIRVDLGYSEPVATEEAIARTVAWERESIARGEAGPATDYEAEDQALLRIDGGPPAP